MSAPIQINIEGMTCSHCASNITRFLEKEGMKEVMVNFPGGDVTFVNDRNTPLQKIKEGIHKLGYKVNESGKKKSRSGYSPLEVKFFICCIFTLPLLLHMFFAVPFLHEPLFQLSFCLPVILIGIDYFGKSAWNSLTSGMPNMDVLIAIGSLSSFIYSIAGWILYYDSPVVHDYLFFETSATIITLVMLGNIIEHRSVKRTNDSLEELLKIQPEKARQVIIAVDKKEIIKEVSINDLIRFDTVLINDGDQVPADGKIILGSALLDESTITGESMPAEKSVGDEIRAGTILRNGSIKMRVEKTGSETVLSNIISLVKNARLSKPEIQRIGDKVSAVFVPAVITISILTFLTAFFFLHLPVQKSLLNAIAVLVISCPCAMGLATPTAIAVGIGRAAKSGILIKGGKILESIKDIDTIVFDKTGTLTTGKFTVNNFQIFHDDKKNIESIIVQMEKHSSHPIAKSLIRYFTEADEKFSPLSEITEEKGIGMSAKDKEGNQYSLSSKADNLSEELKNFDVYLSKNKNVIAALKIADEIRHDAMATVNALKRSGYKIILLSGDRKEKCAIVASATGIDQVFAEQLPHQKSEVIAHLKKEGKVMMIGDGINDAPSLALADIGLSFGNASNIAINQAGIILLNNNKLYDIVNALQMAKHTLVTIKQNLFWAFFYNVIAIPVAAIGWLSPMIGALSMAFSDVIVIGNSIRLRFKKIG